MGNKFFNFRPSQRKLYVLIASLFSSLTEYITFVRQPLRKKFTLFSIGVLFWILVISSISISALVCLGRESNRTFQYFIPQGRATQQIIRDVQNLRVDAYRLEGTHDMESVMRIRGDSNDGIKDIRHLLYAMGQGGTVNEFDREDKLVGRFSIDPARGSGRTFVKGMSGLMYGIKAGLDKLSVIKLETLNLKTDGGPLENAMAEYDTSISKAIALSDEYSYGIAAAYSSDPQKVREYISIALLVLFVAILMAILLLIVFTATISNSVIKPVKAVTVQIQSLSKGYIDSSKRIKTTSGDEIGRLAIDFNALMETMDSLTKFKKAIEEDEDLADVYSRLAGEFKYYGFDGFTIYEVANSQNKMKPVCPVVLSGAELPCNQEILENCQLCRAKKTGHSVSSIEFPGICKYFLQGDEMEHICVPLMLGGTAGGVVQFLAEKSGMNSLHKEAIEGWLNAARRYMEESVPVIETKRLMATLKESALKDALTGLHNRRFLQECAESLVAGTIRRGKNIGLIMGDLDFFKQVNDIYGHNTGDTVLKETAEVFKKGVRAADLVIRFGGEEFLLVLMDVAQGESMAIAEKIREKMESTKFRVTDGVLKKTISLGVSEFPLDTESFWQCIKFADVALYEAKNSGRNKCVRFASEMWKDEQF